MDPLTGAISFVSISTISGRKSLAIWSVTVVHESIGHPLAPRLLDETEEVSVLNVGTSRDLGACLRYCAFREDGWCGDSR